MINPVIKQQLESCRVANVPLIADDATSILIPKGSIVQVSTYQVNKCYLVELADVILHPSPDNTLSANWNNGTVPKYKYYKAEISQIMGKMVKICGCGYDMATNTDTCDVWEGWVPQQGIRLIHEL